MIDPIRELNIRAKLLHHDVDAGVASAAERLRALPELRRASADQLTAFASRIQRKHCLAAAAREAGFQGWEHAIRVLGGDEGEPDHGELLCPKNAATFLNHWFANYDEAREVHAASGGYLLAFRRQSFIAGSDYVATTRFREGIARTIAWYDADPARRPRTREITPASPMQMPITLAL